MDGSSKSAGFPTEGRLLGLDFGTRRLGVAVSTPEQSIASPLETLQVFSDEVTEGHLRQLVAEYGIVGLVVGLPVHMSGEEGEKARQARTFGQRLAERLNLPVCFWDERFTSALADDALAEAGLSRQKRKARLDKLAAQMMLQSFLDAPDRDAAPPAMR